MKSLSAIIILLLMSVKIYSQTDFPEINPLFKQGEFTKTAHAVNAKLSSGGVTPAQEYDLRFTLDLMNRIRIDFTKTRAARCRLAG